MQLLQALRLSGKVYLAITGAGGKTTALFQMARQMPPPVWVTTTTHLGLDQLDLADRCVFVASPSDLPGSIQQASTGVTLFMKGPVGETRTQGLDLETLEELHSMAASRGISLLVEADGSRMLPLKAPAEHEPVVPQWVDTVVVSAGLSGLDQPLVEGRIHRPERFSALSGLPAGEPVTGEALRRVLAHPQGGVKGIPTGARRVALLNQADTPKLIERGRVIAQGLLDAYDAALVASLKPEGNQAEGGQVCEVHERTAGIILAAGGSRRLAQPKQLLAWRGEPLVRRVARTAIEAGLSPVVVVTGAGAEAVAGVLADLPVMIVYNPDWVSGQSGSIQAGVRALPEQMGSAVFMLSDQPQVPARLVAELRSAHSQSLAPLVAPRVAGRRANPVLFDRVTFPDLLKLQGDVGGRAIFEKFPIEYVDWEDEKLLLDVDTPEDYQRLLEIE